MPLILSDLPVYNPTMHVNMFPKFITLHVHLLLSKCLNLSVIKNIWQLCWEYYTLFKRGGSDHCAMCNRVGRFSFSSLIFTCSQLVMSGTLRFFCMFRHLLNTLIFEKKIFLVVSKCSIIYHWHVWDISQRKCLLNSSQNCLWLKKGLFLFVICHKRFCHYSVLWQNFQWLIEEKYTMTVW